MITFEQIKKANESIKTTDIKGKEYAEVNQRIKAFRMVYPQGFILPEILSNDNGVCVFRATVGYYTADNEPITLAIGTAYEKESSSFINKTSYIENCETSAVGRALGMAGFGIDTSVASYEEVSNAIKNQKKQDDKPQIDAIVEEPEAEPIKCPKCGRTILAEVIKGKKREPREIIDTLGMCPKCWETRK